MRYIPNTPDDRADMLREIGVSSFEDLLEPIPSELRLKRSLDLPAGKSEWEVKRHLTVLARKNLNGTQAATFMGAGSYDHFVPSAVNALASRSEYATAYTPYQPEVAQGTLQVIYEFQSMVCELFSMGAANASLYDVGTALAEAVILSRTQTKRDTIVWLDSVNPDYRLVAQTLSSPLGLQYKTFVTDRGRIHSQKLNSELTDDTAALVLQYPNFFGIVEDLKETIQSAQSRGIMVVVVADPMAMGVLTPPGEWGADIVVGEGQSLGNYQSYGGPYLGLFTAKQDYVRLMPGRIVGVTKDVDGRRGYVLTLQTREQHIRREKATSNVCTNEGLIATRATFYMSMIGPSGLKAIGLACMSRANYLREKLKSVSGISIPHDGPHFKEFVATVKGGAEAFYHYMSAHNILAGVPLTRFGLRNADDILIAVTENRTQEEMDLYADLARAYMKEKQ